MATPLRAPHSAADTHGRRTVLVVDPDPALRAVFQDALAVEGYSVRAVGSGEDALDALARGDYALVLLDVILPGMSGIEVCRELRARGHYLPVLIVSARGHEFERVMGLDAGADDYVAKPFSLIELLARIRALVRRHSWHASSPDEVTIGEVSIRPRQRLVLRRGRRVHMSALEFELLRYLLTHRNEVISREQLLRDVWGYNELSITRTVDNYVAKLRTQIEPRPHSPQYLVTVHGSGYQLLV